MDKFDIGEIAIFWNPDSPRHLSECMIVEGLQPGRIVDDATMTWRAGDFYRVTFGDDMKYAAEPHQLRKRPGDEHPNNTVSWDTCIFKPSKEKVH